jgi:hypothetical protein
MKYFNKKTKVGNITFDSKKEAGRFLELTALLHLNKIKDLKCQETFVLQRSFTKLNGERLLPITYTPDFTYYNIVDKKLIAEDVKASRTLQDPVYRLKKKMFKAQYSDFTFLETY